MVLINILNEWEKLKIKINNTNEKETDLNKIIEKVYNSTADLSDAIGDETGNYDLLNPLFNKIERLVSGDDLNGSVGCGFDKNKLYYYVDSRSVDEVTVDWLKKEINKGIENIDSSIQNNISRKI